MTLHRFLLSSLICLAAAGPVQASPFCVQVTGIPLQCLYADPAQCQQEADRLGGICASNPAEFATPAGGSAFCTVEHGNVPNCVYADRRSCTDDARRKSGTCIAATPEHPPKATDPFEVKRPY
jgi:hypothetical protein